MDSFAFYLCTIAMWYHRDGYVLITQCGICYSGRSLNISRYRFFWNPVSVAFLTPKMSSGIFWASEVGEYWWIDAVYRSSGLWWTSFALASKSPTFYRASVVSVSLSFKAAAPTFWDIYRFLGAGADEFRKATAGLMSVRRAAHIEQHNSHANGFREISY